MDRELRLFILGPIEKIEVSLRGNIINSIGRYYKAKINDLASTGPGMEVYFNLMDPSHFNLNSIDNLRSYKRVMSKCLDAVKQLNWTREDPLEFPPKIEDPMKDYKIFKNLAPCQLYINNHLDILRQSLVF